VLILRNNLNEVMPSNNKKREKRRSPSFAMMNKKWCFCFYMYERNITNQGGKGTGYKLVPEQTSK
jgi:hypothetical protein